MSLSSLIPAGGDFCVLRADVVDTLLTCRDGDSALVYLYLVRKGQAFDEREALRDLHLTRDRYDRAVHTLTNLRLVHTPNEQPVQERSAVPPRYSVSEMRAQREDDHRFASVCQTAEIVLGRPLTDSQTRTLMNAYEYLGLPADVLIDLLTYLHRSKGTVSRRDIDEQAHLWADMGIFSADAAAAFLAQREREKPLMDEMLRVLDMAGRDPAPDEYRYLSQFIRQGFDADAVELAKDRLYQRIGRFSWKYLKGILDSWHDKGVHTVEEITALEPAVKQQTAPSPAAPQSEKLQDWEKDWLDQLHASAQNS